MLEIKNLTKIYKTKGAADVVALKKINLSFNNTGMVFLLGKSGSGKSTLLNVLGGLDKFDEGEIIINGKSSKNFKEHDFDSYRNTFLGFIFQEYNVLQEFTVQKNIALALELQGKKADKETIDNLLEQVDLKGLSKRKPNQLSGGQKQRIAIARALIKNPEIIMADEPTGALDSSTGKQVLDTLKKLSQNKLVIVVSHDREFAEQYGDRIIELKDGEVIKDVTKRKAAPKPVSDGFSLVGDNVIHISKGHKITDKERDLLNKVLDKADDDGIYLSMGSSNKAFKAANKIDENGNSEYFNSTTTSDIEPSPKKNINFIKSKLKYKDSLKMGASGLKSKKVRLFFTILLSAIALALFGVANTMSSFDVRKSNYESLKNMQLDNFMVQKQIYEQRDSYSYRSQVYMSEAEADEIQTKYKDYEFIKRYRSDSSPYLSSSGKSYDNYLLKSVSNYAYYIDKILNYVNMSQQQLDSFGFTLVGSNSRLPAKSDEIAITKYMFEVIKAHGYSHGDIEITPDNVTESSLIGKDFDGKKIVGIVDTQVDLSKYESLKENTGYNYDWTFANTLQNELTNKLGTCAFVTEDALTSEENICIDSFNTYFYVGGKDTSYNSLKISKSGDNILNDAIFFDSTKTSLAEDEIIIGNYVYIYRNYERNCDFWASLSYNNEDNENKFVAIINNKTVSTKSELATEVRDIYAKTYNNAPYISCTAFNSSDSDEKEYKIVGVYYSYINILGEPYNRSDYDKYSYSSEDMALHFKNAEVLPFDSASYFNNIYGLQVKLLNQNSDRDLIYYLSEYNATEDTYIIISPISSFIMQYVNIIEMLANIFLYVGIGFAVFAALLLMNFITVSISYKKKEIGILRALGARSTDVYGIFFNESLIISLINLIVATIFTIVTVWGINYFTVTGLNINLILMSFGFKQFILMLFISLLIATVASFLPTHKISRMKPIDAINERAK